MALLEKYLEIKTSTIPGSGLGLFTKEFIPKGAHVIEYKGRITTWKNADKDEGRNAYLFRVKQYHTLDARPYLKAKARYANDANGFTRVKGLKNNCVYVIEGLRVFVEAVKDIPAGSEILVDYGKEYWQIMKENMRLAEKAKKEELKKSGKARR
ncbi:MAG TPA: SET domain-containing protein [Flavisolibacter sp.]|nr:SET domain-containing protein [Flavisolibacter sp.]